MTALGITNPIVYSSQQKKLSSWYHGFVVGLDEALVEGDHVFADALWRYLWAQSENCTPARLNSLIHYVRREMKNLDQTESRLLFAGLVRWGTPIVPRQ